MPVRTKEPDCLNGMVMNDSGECVNAFVNNGFGGRRRRRHMRGSTKRRRHNKGRKRTRRR